MSYIFSLKKNVSTDISVFKDDRYLYPVLVLRGIRYQKAGNDKYIAGWAIGLKWWRWGYYFSILWERYDAAFEKAVANIIDIDILKKNQDRLISIAKSF